MPAIDRLGGVSTSHDRGRRRLLRPPPAPLWADSHPSDPGCLNPPPPPIPGVHPGIGGQLPRLLAAVLAALLGGLYGRHCARPREGRLCPASRPGARLALVGLDQGITPGQRGCLHQVCVCPPRRSDLRTPDARGCAWPNPGATVRRPLTACIGFQIRWPASVLVRQGGMYVPAFRSAI